MSSFTWLPRPPLATRGWPQEAAQAGGRTHLACKFARLSDPRSRACRRHHSAPAREGRYVRVGKPCARGRSLLPAYWPGNRSPLARTCPPVTGTEKQRTWLSPQGQSEPIYSPRPGQNSSGASRFGTTSTAGRCHNRVPRRRRCMVLFNGAWSCSVVRSPVQLSSRRWKFSCRRGGGRRLPPAAGGARPPPGSRPGRR